MRLVAATALAGVMLTMIGCASGGSISESDSIASTLEAAQAKKGQPSDAGAESQYDKKQGETPKKGG